MEQNETKCRVCGCTQLHGCPGGCYWIEEDLCSQCASCETCGVSGHDANILKCERCGKLCCDNCGESLNDGDSFVCYHCLKLMNKRDCNKCRKDECECPFAREYSYCYDCEDYEPTDINTYIEDAHKNAVNHGWWDKPKSEGDLLALLHSEISEVLEEHRDHRKPNETYFSGSVKVDQLGDVVMIAKSKIKGNKVRTVYGDIQCDKPEGIPSELADVVIRIFDMCGYYGIDLETAIIEKMMYNKTRPYKHGGKKL